MQGNDLAIWLGNMRYHGGCAYRCQRPRKFMEQTAKNGAYRKRNANKIKGCAGETFLGKGEVESSILSCSTSKKPALY